ncbi:MAG: rRNA maturation RNase YbeY [Candidatus Marinimicrobia bacterium]|nr:rRNA maturation RNase YbeY [Candidatus Neomarinimicrobiota bacterium]MCK4446103.1 rRNA maturation RNase YbeY [Candidatus Neomarinimicrobiota bacterium]
MPCIKITNIHPNLFLLRPTIERITQSVASNEKKSIKNVTLVVTDDSTLSDLKIKFFGEDLITDTISFNYNEIGEPIEGEIYLSIDRIIENSKNYNVSFEQELARVIIHSLLHLMGYSDDKPRNKKQMTALQNFYLQQQDLKRLYRKRSKPLNS